MRAPPHMDDHVAAPRRAPSSVESDIMAADIMSSTAHSGSRARLRAKPIHDLRVPGGGGAPTDTYATAAGWGESGIRPRTRVIIDHKTSNCGTCIFDLRTIS